MKEILIHAKFEGEQFKSKIQVKGFDRTKPIENTLEVAGVLENIKQQELNKLNSE